MKRNASITVLRGVKTSVFLLAVVGASLLLSLSSSRPAQAESLLYGLRCTVTGLLGRSCAPATEAPAVPSKSQGEEGGDTEQPSSSGTARPTSPATADEQVVSPQPITMDDSLLEEVPAVASANSLGRSYSFPAHMAPVVYMSDAPEVLGQTATMPLEASQDGWLILGVSWVWWFAVVATFGAVAILIKRLVSAHKTSGVAKTSK